MTATLTTKTAKTADPTPASFQTALVDLAGDGTRFAIAHALIGLAGTLVDPASDASVQAVTAKVEAVRALIAGTLNVQGNVTANFGALNGAATDATLNAVLSAIKAQYDLSSTLFTDNSGAYYVRRDVINSTNGTVVVSFTTVTGAVATPGAGLRPASTDANRSTQQISYTATTAATGYAVGDALARLIVLDTSTSPATVISSAWLNVTAGTVLSSAPASGTYATSANSTVVTSSALPTGAATDVSVQAATAKMEAVRALLAAALTFSLPTGASTSALQSAGNTTLTSLVTLLQGAVSTYRPPLTYTKAAGTPFTLTSSWQKVVTTVPATRALRISPIATQTAYDIEWVSVAAGAGIPTDAFGEPVLGGEDFAGGVPIGDIYLKSVSGQVAIVKTGA